ncbi:MAG: penicillin-binding protein 2 [Pseudomonadota bacterium]|nr:penicillin-binding protein 2 [Pseudomonadota bacterium]
MKFDYFNHPHKPAPGTARKRARQLSGDVQDSPASEIPGLLQLQGIKAQALNTSRNRLIVTGVLLALAFAVIAGRLVELAVDRDATQKNTARISETPKPSKVRANITDRNGILLATSLPTAALYANPNHVLDPILAAKRLARILPELDEADLRKKLSSKSTFVWLHRNLTPDRQFKVNTLGIPGLYFQGMERRVHPHGALAAHVLGITDIDGKGLSGVEMQFDNRLTSDGGALTLSLDIRVQAMFRDALSRQQNKFSAIGAVGVLLDVQNGEVISMVSLPDYDPNSPVPAAGDAVFNRATKGVYEMGSTFKLFTAAMALDTGASKMTSRFDATKPIRIHGFTISDYHAKNRWLTVPEILIHSSNIGAAKMAMQVGTARQKQYLRSFGLTQAASIELPEVGTPLTPNRWRDVTTMTIAYGYGIAVSPLQLTAAVATLVNGGYRVKPTILLGTGKKGGERILKAGTSKQMRDLMRLVVTEGSGKNAATKGFLLGGKTGTAEKPDRQGYGGRRVRSSFIAVFPFDAPRYAVLALFDEPKGLKETHGNATGGWVAAPVVKEVVQRLSPLLGLRPRTELAVGHEITKAKIRQVQRRKDSSAVD